MRNLLLLGFVLFFMAFMVLESQKAPVNVCTLVEEKIVRGELKTCVYECPEPSGVVVTMGESDKPCPRMINRSLSI